MAEKIIFSKPLAAFVCYFSLSGLWIKITIYYNIKNQYPTAQFLETFILELI